MNKRVLLIQPRHGIWDGICIRFPESLLSIAGKPHKMGYNVKILDCRVTEKWENVLKNYLKEGKPICVGITALTGPAIKDLLTSIKIIKEIDKSIPIVFGGVHATLLPKQSLAYEGIDVVMKGEGDYTFFEVVKIFEKNSLNEVLSSDLLNNVKGVYYYKRSTNGISETTRNLKGEITIKDPHTNDIARTNRTIHKNDSTEIHGHIRTDSAHDNKNIVFTGDAPLIMNLDELPDSPYELLDLTKYNAVDLGNGVSASIATSRGCPFACKFCGNEILQQRKMRTISIPKLVSKIKMLQTKYGYNSFLFVDDLTIAGRKHLQKFAGALAKIRPRITWEPTGIRANLISKLSDDDLKLLCESGCRALDIGIETGSARIMKYIQKADTKENMLKANKMLSTFPFIIKYTFIIGYPTETDEERAETIDFYLQLKKDNPNIFPMFVIYLPIVGTLLYNDIIRNKLFDPPNSLKKWIDIDSSSWFYKHENWIPNSKRRELSMVMISSLFASEHAAIKFATKFGKIGFKLYHPLAKMRFNHKFFKAPIESFLISGIQKIFPNLNL